MKHFLLKTILPAFLLLGAASLTACNNNKLPSTSYEKVKFAFSGVEKSFQSPKAAKKSVMVPKKERLGGSNTDAGLSTIFSLYTNEDKRDDFLEDVEYNQPPMIQFQYIKKVLEKVGDGYEFGTKYFDTITGDVYLDIATGFKSNNENDKFAYTFGLAMDINIDSNDLITADVSFDIKIARGQEEYKTKWYVAIELDYDMNNDTPNYEMTMVTENNESELPYYQHYTYEYDYVKVKDSSISEWRKFCMDNNNRLVKDAAHPNFESYTRGDAKYKVDACSWYKDGVYYKNKRTRELNGSEAKIVGEALYNDLGLNANEINADVFFNKSSTQNSVLKTCYQEFCNIAKEDIIYSLLTREEQGGDHGGDHGGDDEDRLDPSWPSQSLIDDGYTDVPGFYSKTATFNVSREYSPDTDSYFYLITVLNFQDDDFYRFIRALIENDFREEKAEEFAIYLHPYGDDGTYYAVSIIRNGGMDVIAIGKTLSEEVKEDIAIQNANDYKGDYSSYKEITYTSASEIAGVVERVSGGKIAASMISQYVITGSSKSYEIRFDEDEFTDEDLRSNYTEYIKSYSNWKIIDSNGAFYSTVNGIDVLIMLDKDSSNGIINIHSFAFTQGSIAQIISGQGGGEEGSGEGGGQQAQKITINLYEVNEKGGAPTLVNSYEFDEGQMIDVKATFGEGEYFEDPGCMIALGDTVIAHDGLSIYRKISSPEQTQGSIVIIDANTKQELFSYTDVIGATVKGGAIFNYVLYSDSSCGTMVALDEELTIGEDPITLYCKDYSEVDYVTLTVNTYINGVLSQNQIREFGVRRGEILSNFNSSSFPIYYSHASYYDNEFTMTLNGNALTSYSQDLIALTSNAVLNIYCNNDWCAVYHLNDGSAGSSFDIVWEGGALNVDDVVLHGSKFYTISEVNGSNASYNKTETAYTYSLCSVYNGKVITTQKDYFPVTDGQGYSFIIDPNSEPVFFLDAELTIPLMPEDGQIEVMFTNSFTIYTRFTRA